MRRTTSDRARARGIGSSVRALVAAATAALGVSAALLVAASPAGAAPVQLTMSSVASSGVAGTAYSTITVTGGATGNTIQLVVTGTGTPTVVNATATDSAGSATFSNFTIDTSGSWTVTAHDVSDSTDYPDSTGAPTTVSPSSLYSLGFVTQPPTTTTGTIATFTVAVEDAYGNTIATGTGNNDSINITTSTSGCTLGGTDSAAASSGVATFSAVTLAGTGADQGCVLTATDATNSIRTATSAHGVSLLGAPAKLAFTTEPQASVNYGVALGNFAVSVEDGNGNTEVGNTGSTDTIQITPSVGCTAVGTTSVAAVNGVATFSGISFSGTASTNCSFTASDTTRTLTTAVSTAIAVSGTSPAKLGFSTQPATTASAGVITATFKVSTEEGNGTVLTSGTDTTDNISLSSTCKLVGSTIAVEIGGTATFSNVTFETAGACTIIATDTSSTAIAAATSNVVTVYAGTPTHLAFTTAPPTTDSSITAPIAAFKVSVEDFYDNVEVSTTGSTDTVVITSNCTLSGTTSVAAVAGVATFSALTITSPGSCTLSASDVSRSVTAATALVTVGLPQTTLVVSSTSGYLYTPLKLTTSGGSGTGAVTFAVVNGTAKGCAIVNGALVATSRGTCIVTATKAASGTYALATSAATTVTVGAPLPKAFRVVGSVFWGHQVTITVTGRGFYGRPRVISNARGFSARVVGDNGSQLRLVVYVSPANHAGVHVLTIVEPNGKRTSVRYVLRG